MRMRASVVVALALVTATSACSQDQEPGVVSVSGTAFAFNLPGTPYGYIDGGTVTVLEDPDAMAMTAPDGTFTIEGLTGSSQATFVIEAEGFPIAQTKTFTLPNDGPLDRVTFQVPEDSLYDAIAGLLAVDIDPERCQIVSTVTRVGKSLYDEGAHGEAGATVFIAPAAPEGSGPVYFGDDVIPDPALTESSTDGGVLYTNVPPGIYTLEADKDGVEFTELSLNCRAGVLVNASPPYGLQAL